MKRIKKVLSIFSVVLTLAGLGVLSAPVSAQAYGGGLSSSDLLYNNYESVNKLDILSSYNKVSSSTLIDRDYDNCCRDRHYDNCGCYDHGFDKCKFRGHGFRDFGCRDRCIPRLGGYGNITGSIIY